MLAEQLGVRPGPRAWRMWGHEEGTQSGCFRWQESRGDTGPATY